MIPADWTFIHAAFEAAVKRQQERAAAADQAVRDRAEAVGPGFVMAAPGEGRISQRLRFQMPSLRHYRRWASRLNH
jgi:hypothetical protein